MVTVKEKEQNNKNLILTLPKTTVFLNVKGELKIQPTVKLETTEIKNATIAYTSDNTKIATVDKEGKITAISQGNANITVTAKYSGKTAKAICSVYIMRRSR